MKSGRFRRVLGIPDRTEQMYPVFCSSTHVRQSSNKRNELLILNDGGNFRRTEGEMKCSPRWTNISSIF